MLNSEQAVEIGIALSSTIVGVAHHPSDWADFFKRLHGLGTAGAFVNGGLCLLPATVILACHQSVTFPKVVVTVFGLLLALKASVCFLLPNTARIDALERAIGPQLAFEKEAERIKAMERTANSQSAFEQDVVRIKDIEHRAD